MNAFDAAFDLLKRFVIASDNEEFVEGEGNPWHTWDGGGDLEAFEAKLIDTQGGKNIQAGHFTLESPTAQWDDLGSLDEYMDQFVQDAEDLEVLAQNINWMRNADMEHTAGLHVNPSPNPIIHANLQSPYVRQGLYQTRVLPTLIDRMGGVTSDRWNRSNAADRAHAKMQQMAANDYRIMHTNPKPFKGEFTHQELLNTLIDGAGLEFDLDDEQDAFHYTLASDAVDELFDYNRYDNYEKVLPQHIQRGWGALKPSPRIIPIVHTDDLSSEPVAAHRAAMRGPPLHTRESMQMRLNGW